MNETWWRGENQLDDDQKAVIALQPDVDHLILGPPGSGKTNLLLLRANYLHLGEFPNVLVLVFTRTLQEFLKSGASNYSFSPNKIQTYCYWQKKFLADHGVKPIEVEGFEEQRESLFKQMSQLIDDQGLENEYDAIVIDEAQDYLPKEIPLFKRLAKVLFVAGDPKQKIYAGGNTIDKLKELIPSVSELTYHYRTGQMICRVADEIAKSSKLNALLHDTCNYDEGARPSEATLIKCASLDSQCERIIQTLKIQKEAYPDELLGVLCPKHTDLEAVGNALLKSDLGALVTTQTKKDYISFVPLKPICVCTIHSAKGLEFRAVHVVNIENVAKFQDRQKRLAYTAITRAKTTLSVYHSEEVPGYVESAFASIHTKKKVEIRDAFGK